MRHAPYRLAAMALMVLPLVASLVASGCGGSPTTRASEKVVSVKLRDFRISAPKRVPAGPVVFSVRNKGPDDHELLVIREDDSEEEGSEEDEHEGSKLRADGMTIDEDGLGPAVVGGLEPGEPNEVRKLRVNLEVGHYELVCNMSGHYFGGMETDLTVY